MGVKTIIITSWRPLFVSILVAGSVIKMDRITTTQLLHPQLDQHINMPATRLRLNHPYPPVIHSKHRKNTANGSHECDRHPIASHAAGRLCAGLLTLFLAGGLRAPR